MSETKVKLPEEIEQFLKIYAEWYERNKPAPDLETADSNPNDPPPPPPGPIKP